MEGPIVAQIAATVFVVIVYSIFKSLFGKAKEQLSSKPNSHIVVPKTFQEKLHVNNKEGLLERIDYWIEQNDYKEALHICNIYTDNNKSDGEIAKRIRFLNKNI